MEDRNEKNKTKLLQTNLAVFFGAMLCCALWGSAFSVVKIGMKLFEITNDQVSNQVVFAGTRFAIAGLLVVIIGSISERKILWPSLTQCKKISVLSIFQTIGQYFFFYVGLSHTMGVNASIVNSLANFFAILFACLLFRTEKLTRKKVIGCMLGVAGVLIVNTTSGGISLHMTLRGEGLILASTLCYSISSALTKTYTKDDNPVLLSGYQFLLGGIVLVVGGILAGGTLGKISVEAILVLAYLALVSTIAYTVWTILLKYNDVSKVAIYGFMNPIFGVVFSIILLGETNAISINYLLALVVISIGITIVTK